MFKVPKTTGLQYLCNKYVKTNMKNGVEFFPVDKCRRFLQSDTTILGVYGQELPYYPK